MRTGNLAEPVLKRSVFRQLNMEIAGVLGHYGADCVSLYEDRCLSEAGKCEKSCTGEMPYEENPETQRSETLGIQFGKMQKRLVFASTGPVPGADFNLQLQVNEVVNRLAAGGADAQSLMIQAVLPQTYEEADLRADMRCFASAAEKYSINIEDTQIHVSAGVLTPQYFLTAAGVQEHSALWQSQRLLKPGQELVVTKWIALAGTSFLAEKYETDLHERYPFSLIDRAKEFGKLISVAEEARAITHFGACAMHHLSQGGIFNALWEMADRAGVGLEVDLKKIPVKQETVEICEYFDINPYYLYSAGSLLIGTDRAEALLAQLAAIGVPAAVIGRVTDGNDRVIRNGEDCRFLDRPKQDEWYRYQENRKHV